MTELHCPHCVVGILIKKGRRNGKKRYKCKSCGRWSSNSNKKDDLGVLTSNGATTGTARGPVDPVILETISLDKNTVNIIARYQELKMDIPHPDYYNPRTMIDNERKIIKLNQDLGSANLKMKYLEKELTSEKIKNEVYEILEKNTLNRFHTKVEESFKNDNEAAAVICLSDLHLEEDVDPSTINGLNEYNPVIAETRFKKVFQNALKLIKQQEKDIKISNIILWLGGDIITNYIHAELMETNHMSPNRAILFADELITWGIDFLLDNTKCQITVPTNHGNHGRSTEFMRIQSAASNSWEYLLYRNLERRYAKEKRIRFQVAEGYHNYLDVFNFKIRFHHGDSLRYNGGSGGIFIPANKAISEWDRGIRADLDVFGHFHQLVFSTKFVCNGSLIGYGPYALSIKASPEDAQQAFFLVDKNRNRITMRAPIFVD